MAATTRPPKPERVESWWRHVRLTGGRASGVCRGRDLTYRIGTASRSVHSQCCGGQTRADVPYEAVDGSTRYARVCAVCDAATDFPRLSE